MCFTCFPSAASWKSSRARWWPLSSFLSSPPRKKRPTLRRMTMAEINTNPVIIQIKRHKIKSLFLSGNFVPTEANAGGLNLNLKPQASSQGFRLSKKFLGGGVFFYKLRKFNHTSRVRSKSQVCARNHPKDNMKEGMTDPPHPWPRSRKYSLHTRPTSCF